MDAGFGKIGKHVNRQKCQYSIVNDVNTETNLSENCDMSTNVNTKTVKDVRCPKVRYTHCKDVDLSGLAWEDQ